MIGNDDNQPNEFWSGWHLTYKVDLDGDTVFIGHAFGPDHDPGPTVDVTGHHNIELIITATVVAGGGRNHRGLGRPGLASAFIHRTGCASG